MHNQLIMKRILFLIAFLPLFAQAQFHLDLPGPLKNVNATPGPIDFWYYDYSTGTATIWADSGAVKTKTKFIRYKGMKFQISGLGEYGFTKDTTYLHPTIGGVSSGFVSQTLTGDVLINGATGTKSVRFGSSTVSNSQINNFAVYAAGQINIHTTAGANIQAVNTDASLSSVGQVAVSSTGSTITGGSGNAISVPNSGNITLTGKVSHVTMPTRNDTLTQVYVRNRSTGEDEVRDASTLGGGGAWGSITGTLSSQTDLQSALDAKSNLTWTPNVTTTAAYTLQLSDVVKQILEQNATGVCSVTVPPNSSVNFPNGTKIEIQYTGIGNFQLIAGAGVTFRGPQSGIATTAGGITRYGKFVLEQSGTTNTWNVWVSGTQFATNAGAGLSSNGALGNPTLSLDLTANNTWTGTQTFSADPVFNLPPRVDTAAYLISLNPSTRKFQRRSVSSISGGSGITALTGDVTASGSGSVVATIKTNVALAGSPTTTTQAASDNSTKIATTAQAQAAIKAGTSWLDADKYGMVPNSTSSATANTAALRVMVASATDGVRIHFPKGIWYINDTISVTKYLSIEGDDRSAWNVNSTTIAQMGINKSIFVVDVGTSAPAMSARSLSLLYFGTSGVTGTGNAPTSGAGIRLLSGYFMSCRDVNFTNFYKGIEISGYTGSVGYWQLEHCEFLMGASAGIAIGNHTHSDEGDWNISDCQFYNALGSAGVTTNAGAIYWHGSGGGKIIGNKINGGGFMGNGILLSNTDGNTVDMQISGNSIENYTNLGIGLTGGSFGLSQINICYNEIYGTGASVNCAILIDQTPSNIIVSGNTIGQFGSSVAGPGIRYLSVAGGNITNNTITNFTTDYSLGSSTDIQVFQRQVEMRSVGNTNSAFIFNPQAATINISETSTGAANGINVTNKSATGVAQLNLFNDVSSAGLSLLKAGSSIGSYKNFSANDVQFYNSGINGNISFLNDYASGNINFAAGAASSAQLTLNTTGQLTNSFLAGNGSGVASVDNSGNIGFTTLNNSTLFNYFADVQSVSTTETDLYTNAVAANTLATNGDKIKAEYTATLIMTGGATKDVRIYFGGTKIFDTGLLTIGVSSVVYQFHVSIIRDGSSSVRCTVESTTPGNPDIQYTNVTGLTFSSTNILKITGQSGAGAATGDVTANMGYVTFLSH